jgi:hypothetical protein
MKLCVCMYDGWVQNLRDGFDLLVILFQIYRLCYVQWEGDSES